MASRISEETKQSILEEYKNGESVLSLSLKYNVCKSSVSKLVRIIKQEDRKVIKKEKVEKTMSDNEDIDNLQKAVDMRKVRKEIVNGKVMYDVFDFMFGW